MSTNPKEKESNVNRKENILLAAERLFAARGYHGVAIRDIAEEAGVQFALIGYYYGSKLELYHHIFQARSVYMNERLEMLAKVMQKPPSRQALNEIVEAFVGPVLKLAAHPDGRHFLHLISRGMTDQLAEDEKVIQELFDPLAHAFIDAMASVQSHVSRGTIAWCYQFALGALLHHVTDRRIERLSRGENRRDDFELSQPLLVKFIVSGIRGVCGPATATAAKAPAPDKKKQAVKLSTKKAARY